LRSKIQAMFTQQIITLSQKPAGFHLVTKEVISQLPRLPQQGLLHLLLLHTSAGLTLNENTDPDVALDMKDFTDRLVPENETYYRHTLEGPDDLPAHIKASIFGHSLTIPIANKQLVLGQWQGIYLGEFRKYGSHRRIMSTIQGVA